MTLPSNGITADVIREIMPPYHLSADLLEGTFAALPPPPRDAPPNWRHERITRLIGEIVAFLPAGAGQARLAAQILIARELADTVTTRAYAPDVTVEQMRRLSRTSTELIRTAALLLRTLERCQQKPVPFYGTVIEDEVDVAAVDAVWCNDDMQSLPPGTCPGGETAPDVMPAAGEAAPRADIEPEPAAGQLNAAPFAANTRPSPAATPVPPSAETAVRAQLWRSPDGAAGRGQDVGSTSGPAPGSVVTRLDQGPGWTLDVVRPRTGGGAAPGSAV
jgi:hypothetical protein